MLRLNSPTLFVWVYKITYSKLYVRSSYVSLLPSRGQYFYCNKMLNEMYLFNCSKQGKIHVVDLYLLNFYI